MLAIKYTPNILLISVCVSSLHQQDICYVKVCILKNWKQLFLSKLILNLFGQEHGIYLFLFLTYTLTRYLRNIYKKKFLNPRRYPREKVWTHEIPTRKNFRPTKYPWEKMWDPRNTHEKKFSTHKIPTRKNYGLTKAQWHDSTRPARPTMARDPRSLAHSALSNILRKYI